MDTSGKRAVGPRDSGFINVGGRRKQPNDDLRTPRKTNLGEHFLTPWKKNLNEDFQIPRRKNPDDELRALRRMKLEKENAKKELTDFRTPWTKYLDDDIRELRSMKLELDKAKKELQATCAKCARLKESELQVNHLSTENKQLKLNLQLSNEDKEKEKIQMKAENDKIRETLREKDIYLEDSRKQIKILHDLLNAYQMLLGKTEEKNPTIRSNKEYKELSSHWMDSNEEVKQMKTMFEEYTVNIVMETMAVASEATNNRLDTMGAHMAHTNNKLETMGAQMEAMFAITTQFMSMMKKPE